MKLLAEKFFFHGELLENQLVTIKDDQVQDHHPAQSSPQDNPSYYQKIALLTPRFVDLQVNGGGGVLLNNEPTAKTIRSIRDAHQSLGTGAILPTLITDAPKRMEQAVDAMLEVWGEKGILGIHLEGPHINVEKRGTHDARFIRPFDAHTLSQLKRLREAGIPTMLTLAPETVTPADIRAIRDLGVVISAGHSMASFAEALEGFNNGITCATHLYNAMPVPSSRSPGLAMAGLLHNISCGIIADGIHVSEPMLELAHHAKTNKSEIFIVSDAMATVGGGDIFTLYDQQIRLQDGRLINAEGALAGAHIDMLSSVRHLVQNSAIPLLDVLHMATLNPLTAMSLKQNEIEGLGWLKLDHNFQIVS